MAPTVAIAKKKDLTSNVKFAITIGAQLFVGLLGVAVTAAVAVYLAKSDDTSATE